MLIVFSGLPGVGKSTLAQALSEQIGATYLRIDSIEAGLAQSVLRIQRAEDAGYMAAFNVARDNLRRGGSVVADSVNPIRLTRDSWRAIGVSAQCLVAEVEVICSNPAEHRRRVDQRRSFDPGRGYPSWQDVLEREYEVWDRKHLIIDTATATFEGCLATLKGVLDEMR